MNTLDKTITKIDDSGKQLTIRVAADERSAWLTWKNSKGGRGTIKTAKQQSFDAVIADLHLLHIAPNYTELKEQAIEELCQEYRLTGSDKNDGDESELGL